MSDRSTLRVIPSPDLSRFLEDSLPRLVDIDTVSHDCPHCGLPVKYPLHVPAEHIEILDMMIYKANEFLNKTGVTAQMLAHIRAQCIIEIAKKGKNTSNEHDDGGGV